MGELTLRPNWTTAAGALEGVLAAEGLELPRHAVMGLTGHAWHLCVAMEGGIVALPNGPHDLDWGAMVERYAHTGLEWERFGRRAKREELAPVREEALGWARERLDEGVPLIGFDLQVHEFAIVTGYDDERGGFLVEIGGLRRDGELRALERLALAGNRRAVRADGTERPRPGAGGAGVAAGSAGSAVGGWGRERTAAGDGGARGVGGGAGGGRRRWTGRGTRTRSRCCRAARVDGAAFPARPGGVGPSAGGAAGAGGAGDARRDAGALRRC